MKKPVYIFLLTSLLFLAGCTSATLEYEDDEIAAVVRGEEITIGDLRFLYPDKGLLDKIEPTAKARLVVQEAKRLEIELSEDEQELLNTDVKTGYRSNRAFAEKQAEKFDMDPKEYYEEYEAIANEMIAYMSAYVTEMVDIAVDDDGEYDVNEFNKKADQLLDELFIKYADEIDIRIQE